ncbi:unnamed protein product [Dovyalis caffra]|uniref:Uncharacterized protein n=1 Tax=Dovyalis caffra TaxID=77055 RepID=A0AAV1RIN1_9ROSI|nr:unnamed protein product [Dovyalis caffra]
MSGPFKIRAIPRQRKSKYSEFLDMIGLGTTLNRPKDYMDVVRVAETDGLSATEHIQEYNV